MLAKILKFFFGTKNQRVLKRLSALGKLVNAQESIVAAYADEEFPQKTAALKERVQNGASLESIIPEAFALVREAAKRTLGQRHYDVQIIGGIVLAEGKIAEMKTGEGKTLTATLPLYLNALGGGGVHLVTVNDYLAVRDSSWMKPLYNFLGVSVGALTNGCSDEERKAIYACDIVYGTNSEFGFDFLRDNMKFRLGDCVQRTHDYAIVDEVDSILIDESRTPLIISGAVDETNAEIYQRVDQMVKRMTKGVEFELDIKERQVFLTEKGIDALEQALGVNNLYDPENGKLLHHVSQALKANFVFKKDFDYIVRDNEVYIVDEFTGRVMKGRRYSEGLHQALEAKERVTIQEESQTLAAITLQNYFRLYKKLAGMTGTALTEAEEFYKIYRLEVVAVPTNQQVRRIDKEDLIFLTEKAKFQHIVKDIAERYQKGQPVLIGTVAVETSERLSEALHRENIPHVVLNAKQNEKEAEIIMHAGERGKITIATNMAGRGTDIKLVEETRELGGLYVLGTERHESRRIDNQLRGRSGRQGDPGESRFYLSLEDDLIRRFAGDTLKIWMQRTGMTEDEVIEDRWVSKTIENAQEKVEKHNFEIRKHLIEYDDVLNQQRTIIYTLRKMIITDFFQVKKVVEDCFAKYALFLVSPEKYGNDTDVVDEHSVELLVKKVQEVLPSFTVVQKKMSCADIRNAMRDALEHEYRTVSEGGEALQEEELYEKRRMMILEAHRWFLLEIIDKLWRKHIVLLEGIREGIGLRGYGQKTPIIEYKNESFLLFSHLIKQFVFEVVAGIFSLDIKHIDIEKIEKRRRRELEIIEQALHAQHREKEAEEKKTSHKKSKEKK